MKTAEEWFSLIKDETIRKNALEHFHSPKNSHMRDGVQKFDTVEDAIMDTLDWHTSPQGENYWLDVYSSSIELLDSQVPNRLEPKFKKGDKVEYLPVKGRKTQGISNNNTIDWVEITLTKGMHGKMKINNSLWHPGFNQWVYQLEINGRLYSNLVLEDTLQLEVDSISELTEIPFNEKFKRYDKVRLADGNELVIAGQLRGSNGYLGESLVNRGITRDKLMNDYDDVGYIPQSTSSMYYCITPANKPEKIGTVTPPQEEYYEPHIYDLVSIKSADAQEGIICHIDSCGHFLIEVTKGKGNPLSTYTREPDKSYIHKTDNPTYWYVSSAYSPKLIEHLGKPVLKEEFQVGDWVKIVNNGFGVNHSDIPPISAGQILQIKELKIYNLQDEYALTFEVNFHNGSKGRSYNRFGRIGKYLVKATQEEINKVLCINPIDVSPKPKEEKIDWDKLKGRKIRILPNAYGGICTNQIWNIAGVAGSGRGDLIYGEKDEKKLSFWTGSNDHEREFELLPENYSEPQEYSPAVSSTNTDWIKPGVWVFDPNDRFPNIAYRVTYCNKIEGKLFYFKDKSGSSGVRSNDEWFKQLRPATQKEIDEYKHYYPEYDASFPPTNNLYAVITPDWSFNVPVEFPQQTIKEPDPNYIMISEKNDIKDPAQVLREEVPVLVKTESKKTQILIL